MTIPVLCDSMQTIRKYWERRWKVIGKDSEVMKAHYAQTPHSAKTAEDHYIGREGRESDRACLLSMYANDLALRPGRTCNGRA